MRWTHAPAYGKTMFLPVMFFSPCMFTCIWVLNVSGILCPGELSQPQASSTDWVLVLFDRKHNKHYNLASVLPYPSSLPTCHASQAGAEGPLWHPRSSTCVC